MLGLLYAWFVVANAGAYAATPTSAMLAEVPDPVRKKQAQIDDEKKKSAARVAVTAPHEVARRAGRKQP